MLVARSGWFGAALAAVVLLASCAAPTSAPSPAAPGTTGAERAPATSATAALPAPRAMSRVRFGHQPLAVFATVYLADERGYFQQEGVDLELIGFGNSSEMLPALATDQIDAAGFSTNAAVWNSVARGVQQRIVLEMSSYRPGYGSTGLVLRKELYDAGRGRRLEDLRGLSLAFTPPGKATGNGCAASAGLQRAGMTLDDLSIQPVPFPDMVPALANGAVDGAMIAEPFLTRTVRQGTAVKVIGLDEMYPDFTVAIIAFSSSLYANRAAAKGFVRAYLRANRDYAAAMSGQASEAERSNIHDVIARRTGTDVAVVRDVTPSWFGVNGLPNRKSLLYCYGFFRDQGLIPEPISDAAFATLWGTDLVEEVLGEIGRLPEN